MEQLVSIAECFNGYTFRERPKHSPKGNVGVIQMSDMAPREPFEPALTIRIPAQDIYQKFYTQVGDIIFRGRGGFHSVLLPQNTPLLMAASPLLILRPNITKIIPAYLLWFLNSQFARQYFERTAQGSILKAIGIRELIQLKLPLPSLANQQKIVNIALQLQQERELVNKLQAVKENWIMHQLYQAANQTDQIKEAV